jgi:hypothetical protein
MSALPPKADMCSALAHVCFGLKADITDHCRMTGGGVHVPCRSAPAQLFHAIAAADIFPPDRPATSQSLPSPSESLIATANLLRATSDTESRKESRGELVDRIGLR